MAFERPPTGQNRFFEFFHNTVMREGHLQFSGGKIWFNALSYLAPLRISKVLPRLPAQAGISAETENIRIAHQVPARPLSTSTMNVSAFPASNKARDI